ncbi:MAG: 2-oxoacid:acceptor oxidoreductase subunit alpha [Planctomycetes bacterium]|nr:2-oxoacid:acceptor oxidoreductase subunit alpha [Planctomycetota bacterium]
MDYSIKIGGEAGQGLQSIGLILAKTFNRAGYHIFTVQDYESRIRGGHSAFYLRFSDKPVEASSTPITFLVCFDKPTLSLYQTDVSPSGYIIYNSDAIKEEVRLKPFDEVNGRELATARPRSATKRTKQLERTGRHSVPVPLDTLALQTGNDKIYANSIALGAVIGLVGCDFNILSATLAEFFGGKHKQGDVVEKNILSAKTGFELIRNKFPQCPFPLAVKPRNNRMVITGSEAIALGALAAGCKFYSGYPMTPSTGILNYMAHAADKMGVVVEQAEDEIAAINMALGASYAGVQAMTATSGGGFALMIEGLSLAAMTETPIVIALGQRPAPATGLPTRTEQADLEYALYAGHGEFPRAIFTPGNAQQCFYLTAHAFQIAEKYQIPVFVLTDQYLADSYQDFEPFDISRIDATRYIMTDGELSSVKEYKRHALTPSGISPRALPGQSQHLVITDSDEHTEDGHLTEDLQVRTQMVDKRLRKYEALSKEVIAPSLEANTKAKTILVSWGSNYGVVKEAAQALDYAALHFQQVWPFPKDDFLRLTQGAQRIIVIENNATGQLARLIKSQTGLTNISSINKYNGLPFTTDELTAKITK